MLLLKLTTDGQKASRHLSATAELLVSSGGRDHQFAYPPRNGQAELAWVDGEIVYL